MPDYRAMYLELLRATEKAVRILEEAQSHCETLYWEEVESETGQKQAPEFTTYFCNGEQLGTDK